MKTTLKPSEWQQGMNLLDVLACSVAIAILAIATILFGVFIGPAIIIAVMIKMFRCLYWKSKWK